MTCANSAKTAESSRDAERITDEVTNCAVFIVEALLAAGIRSPGIPPEDICELIEPHIAATVAEVLATHRTAT